MTTLEHLKELVSKHGADLRHLMLTDPVFFINEIAGIGVDNAKLNVYQEEWVKLVHTHTRVNITAYRSSGKTECLFICYPIYKAFTQPNWEGLLVSATEQQAKEIVYRIKQKIETNPILAKSMPLNKSAAWSTTRISLNNGSRLIAMPYTNKLRGYHVNWAGFDEAGEYGDLDVFESNAYSVIQAKGGSVVTVGTPKSELDLLHSLRKNEQWQSEIFAADTLHPSGKTLWQIRYPTQPLENKKKEVNNNLKFTREFLCRVLSSGDSLFPYGVIEAALDTDYRFEDTASEGTYFMGLDFALSGQTGADYSVYAVYRRDSTGVIRIVRLERYKGLSYPAQKKRIQMLNQMFKPQRIIADEGTFGVAFIQELKLAHLPIKGFKFQHKRNELLEIFRDAFDLNFSDTRNKNGDPVALDKENRRFFINYHPGDVRATKLVDELFNELVGFGVIFKRSKTGDLTGTVKFESVKPHDDLVMACALGYWGARSQPKTNFFVERSDHAKKSALFFSN